MAKLCQKIFHKQTEAPDRLTAGVNRNFAHMYDKKSKASLYIRKSSGKNVTISRL